MSWIIHRGCEQILCTCIVFGCIFYVAFLLETASTKWSALLNAFYICIRKGTSRNMLIQIKSICWKINFHILSFTFNVTLTCSGLRGFIWRPLMLYMVTLNCIMTKILIFIYPLRITEIFVKNWRLLKTLCWETFP